MLKVVVTKSLKNTRWSLGDRDGLPLPRGDPRRRDGRGGAVGHITEDLRWHTHTKKVTVNALVQEHHYIVCNLVE